MEKTSHILCFNCCAIYKEKKSSEINCPTCGYSPNRTIYDKIMNYGIEAAHYGHNYREIYEKQISENRESKTRYALPEPTTILCFLAVAALSGVIGGVSYDIVKSAFKKIIGNANKIKNNIGQNKISLIDDNSINIFVNQMNSFYHDLQDIDPAVRFEIVKEMVVSDLCDALPDDLHNGKYSNEEGLKEIKNALALAKKRITEKPSDADFIDFWKEIR